jgi:hypothetical protein
MEKAGNAPGAKRAYELGLDHYRRHKDKVKDRGLPVAAEAAFRDLEPAWADYRKLTLAVAPKFMKGQIDLMVARLKKLEGEYTQVVKLGVAEPAVCALERIGRLYEHLARSIHDAPIPRELKNDAEMLDLYKSQLAEQAEPVEQKANEGLELAFTKSRELAVRNDCADRAAAAVIARKPELGPGQEALPSLTAAEPPERLAGHGLLAAIEATPAARAKAAPRGEASALPALKLPGQKKGAGKAAAEPAAPPPRPDEPLPRPKKGDDEDLLP